MSVSKFVFYSVDLLYYKLNKISLKRDGSNIYSPKWLKNTTIATIIPKNYDHKCFQHTLTIALSFPVHQKDWKNFV